MSYRDREKNYDWKFKQGQKVRMVKPPKHGPKGIYGIRDEGFDDEDDFEANGFKLMKVGEIYTVKGDMWFVDSKPNILVKPNNGHCQPEDCFESLILTNEERISRRRAAVCHT